MRDGGIKDVSIRLVLRAVFGAYLRVRVEGAEHLPASPYIICFNHPSWSDPLILLGHWPNDGRRFMIFGPREMDMSTGRRNALIRWSGRGIAFKPGGKDIGGVTRRAIRVLRDGQILAIAGEGRLSEREGSILPLQVGLGHYALMAGVPIVPVGVLGTRWLRFGKTIRVRIGPPVPLAGLQRGRGGAAVLTAAVADSLATLVSEAREESPPGPFGRWLSEVFNERPWLTGGK